MWIKFKFEQKYFAFYEIRYKITIFFELSKYQTKKMRVIIQKESVPYDTLSIYI